MAKKEAKIKKTSKRDSILSSQLYFKLQSIEKATVCCPWSDMADTLGLWEKDPHSFTLSCNAKA